MKVLVCGGRNFGKINNYTDGVPQSLEELNKRKAERRFVNDKLTEISNTRGPITEIIEGGAYGADTCAFWWAFAHKIPTTTVNANWELHGRKAGMLRNKEMLELGPDLVVAFPGGIGTAGMVRIAKEAGVEVLELEFDGNKEQQKRERQVAAPPGLYTES